MPATRPRPASRGGRYSRRRPRKRISVLAAFNWYLTGVALGVIGLGRLGLVNPVWLWVPVLACGTVTYLTVRRRTRARVRVVPGPRPAAGSRRPAAQAARSRHIPNQVKIAAVLASNGRCAHCGKNQDLAFDHIIPFNRGGSSTEASNIQILCRTCNSRKRDRYIG